MSEEEAVNISKDTLNVYDDASDDIKKNSILHVNIAPKKGVVESITEGVGSFFAGLKRKKEHTALIKAHEQDSYKQTKDKLDAEKVEKDIAAARERGEFKAKPLTERVKIRKDQIKEKRAKVQAKKVTGEVVDISKTDSTTVTPDEVKTTKKKKSGLLKNMGNGSSAMIKAHSEKKGSISLKSLKGVGVSGTNLKSTTSPFKKKSTDKIWNK